MNQFFTKLSLIFTSSFILAGMTVFSQSTIYPKKGLAPSLNGIIMPNEWNDADSLTFSNVGGTVKVYYKYDDNNFYVAYNIKGSYPFPELMFDVNNSKSTSWQPDDWWFHASGSDCAYQGQYSNYSLCSQNPSNWKATDNGNLNPFVVEIEIPFTTLNINVNTTDTIGLIFAATDAHPTTPHWKYWPSSANIVSPSSWGNAVFLKPAGIKDNYNFEQTIIYPNPGEGDFHVNLSSISKHVKSIEVITNTGIVIYANDNKIDNETILLSLKNLASGSYFLKIQLEDENIVNKFFIID